MPILYRIDQAKRRVVARVVGDFAITNIIEAIEGAVRCPGYEPGFDILSDHTAVGSPITTEQLEQMIAHLRTLAEPLRGSRWAVVTTKPASYGMMRMLSARADEVPLSVAVFGTRQEAEEWLARAL